MDGRLYMQCDIEGFCLSVALRQHCSRISHSGASFSFYVEPPFESSECSGGLSLQRLCE
uniref:Uncharacterized protein n=1 Tax=Anguilla anguilla TaxID=7936 RepID=A0A0E9W3G1_ANGAN